MWVKIHLANEKNNCGFTGWQDKNTGIIFSLLPWTPFGYRLRRKRGCA